MSYNYERDELSMLRGLVGEIVEIIGQAGGDHASAVAAIRGRLAAAGIHPGQVDADGWHVQPPHDADCPWCPGVRRE